MDTFMGAHAHLGEHTPSKASSKRRSISDAAAPTRLAPSPNFRESFSVSKDDIALPPSPQTPRRPDFLSRGLTIQMPPRSLSMAAPNGNNASRAPLSPQLDPLTSYASPATSLPRHSRGLDFSRACTNLHHSTLAEQSSPDSSPIITQKGIGIPSRKASVSSMMLDSPNLAPGSNWPMLGLGNNERSAISSSVGSINMLGSDSGSSDSDDDDLMDPDDTEDAIFTTPQVHKLNNPNTATPFASHTASPTAATWSNNFSPAAASLMKTFQRTRLRKGRSRKSSSSASGHSAIPSPRTTSPPPLRSIESAGYFGWPRLGSNRRESLALGTDQLNLSSGNDSGDEGGNTGNTGPSTPGVVRRAVTRRGNLLPKTKGFARIRAALLEESTPVDADMRREAETIRQVRERDDTDLDHHSIAASSPGLMPVVPGGTDGLEDIPEDTAMGIDNPPYNGNSRNNLNMNFNVHASKNSAGLNYWNKFDKDLRTPPPPSFPTRGSSSMSGDVNMDSPAAADAAVRSTSVVSTGDEQPSSSAHNVDSFARKFGKRRRDDDFDIASIKRRAVSPSLSVHNSPVVSASPARSENMNLGPSSSGWGHPPRSMTRESSVSNGGSLEQVRSNSGDRSNGMGNVSVGPKRVGLQGMVDTNDGLMKMSIE
ncbi:hypothetical protein MBLNU459_g8427t1 [Dothideomycetes sp. NU459]